MTLTSQQRWNRAHPESMRAASKKHRQKNPQVVRKANLLRYGLSVDDFNKEIERQYGRCLGCQTLLTPEITCVDHNHFSMEFRGLLCRQCNWVLGNAKDSKETLRRLLTYLDRDRTKINIYLIGRLKNSQIPSIAESLRNAGYDVMDEWYAAGPDADDCWQAYEQFRGRSFVDALKGRAAQNVFLFDKSHLDLADAAVLVLPAGRSAHLEMGYLLGLGKPVLMLSQENPERFEVMPNFATEVCTSVDGLVVALNRRFAISKFQSIRARECVRQRKS